MGWPCSEGVGSERQHPMGRPAKEEQALHEAGAGSPRRVSEWRWIPTPMGKATLNFKSPQASLPLMLASLLQQARLCTAQKI